MTISTLVEFLGDSASVGAEWPDFSNAVPKNYGAYSTSTRGWLTERFIFFGSARTLHSHLGTGLPSANSRSPQGVILAFTIPVVLQSVLSRAANKAEAI